MFSFIKNLFSNPKTLIKIPIDALDLAVPALAGEIEKSDFLKKTPNEQAQFAVDWIQGHLRKLFKIDA